MSAMNIALWAHECTEDTLTLDFDYSDIKIECLLKDETTSCSPKKVKCIPYPFVEARLIEHDLVLVPSRGNFINGFNDNNHGLHIGIASNQRGFVTHFDKKGIMQTSNNHDRWNQCLPIKFADHFIKTIDKTSIELIWDEALTLLCATNADKWSADHYNNDENNCFDFVLEFLSQFSELSSKRGTPLSELSDILSDKIKFCEHFVIPQTSASFKYLALARKIISGRKTIQLGY